MERSRKSSPIVPFAIGVTLTAVAFLLLRKLSEPPPSLPRQYALNDGVLHAIHEGMTDEEVLRTVPLSPAETEWERVGTGEASRRVLFRRVWIEGRSNPPIFHPPFVLEVEYHDGKVVAVRQRAAWPAANAGEVVAGKPEEPARRQQDRNKKTDARKGTGP
jgi:hypothetical protein